MAQNIERADLGLHPADEETERWIKQHPFTDGEELPEECNRTGDEWGLIDFRSIRAGRVAPGLASGTAKTD